jgi:thiamine biosynthesis lipoprotein
MTLQPAAVPTEGALAVRSWRALGTYVRLVVAEGAVLETADTLLRAEIDDVDRACSRFRDDSDLSLVNRNAGRPVPVGTYLIGALDAALRVAAMTGGLVDPLLGTAVIAAGYDRDFAAVPADGPAPGAVLPRPQEWRRIQVDRWLGTVRIPVGTRLDLGSSGKAHAAQRAAHAIARTTGSGVLVSLGGDIAVAGRPPESGWTVRIAERPEEDGTGSVVVIRDGGVATSSSLLRRWRRAGVDQHHIIDPRTGRPAAEHWRTATVCAASCLDANAASTAAIVMGAGAAEWLDGLGLPSRLVDHEGRVCTVGGWPDEPLVLP